MNEHDDTPVPVAKFSRGFWVAVWIWIALLAGAGFAIYKAAQ